VRRCMVLVGNRAFQNILQPTLTKGDQQVQPFSPHNIHEVVASRIGQNHNYGVYDVENRLSSLSPVSGGQEEYVYGPDNKRVSKIRPDGTEVIYFYGVGGQKLGEYQVQMSATRVYVVALNANLYFGGKLIRLQGQVAAMDRLGSVRALNGAATPRYYPYGMEYTTTAQDKEKFGTYYRDSTTGLDYADQRYYASTQGRFLTADPYRASATSPSYPANPQSWNRYAYVQGDPVNFNDGSGLFRCTVGAGEGQQTTNCEIVQVPGRIPPHTKEEWDDLHPVAAKKIKLQNVSKSGPNEDAILETLQDVLANLDDECAKYLGGRDVVTGRINALMDTRGSPLIAHGTISPTSISAFTGGRQEQFEGNALAEAEAAVGSFAILVNDSGAFFSSNYLTDNGRLQGNTTAARDFVLLHELGHSLGAPGFQDDYANSKAGRDNDNLINSNCNKTFNH